MSKLGDVLSELEHIKTDEVKHITDGCLGAEPGGCGGLKSEAPSRWAIFGKNNKF